MIQKLGGGRVVDYGPSAAIHSRGRVPGGVMVSQATVVVAKVKVPSAPRIPRDETPEQQEARRALARDKYAIFCLRHADCECHEWYGGQPRPIGYKAREQDRAALRREMRA